MATVNLIPDANGGVIGWIAQGDLFHWRCVDDPVGVPDEAATYVHTSLAAREVAFNHVTSPLLTGATISNVRVLARMKLLASGGGSFASVNIGVRIGPTRFAQPFNHVISAAWTNYTADWPVHPLGGAPWTKSDIDNLESSLLSVVNIFASSQCTQIYFIITYTPGGAGPVAGHGLVSWTP